MNRSAQYGLPVQAGCCAFWIGAVLLMLPGVGEAQFKYMNPRIYDLRGRPLVITDDSSDVSEIIGHYKTKKVSGGRGLGETHRQPPGEIVFHSDVVIGASMPISADRPLIDILSELTGQHALTLSGKGVTEKALACLKYHGDELQRLYLAGGFQGDAFDGLELRVIRGLLIRLDSQFRDWGTVSHVMPGSSGLCQLSDKGIAGISRWTTLTSVQLYCCNLDDDQLPPFGKLTQLQSLEIPGSRLTGATLPALETCLHLEDLDLDGCRLTDRTLTKFPDLPLLHTLILPNNQLGDAGVARILAADLPRLNWLDLSRTDVTEQVFEMIGTRQIRIKLEQTRIDYGKLAANQAGRHLKTLLLADTGFTDSDLEILKSFPNLEEIDLSFNPVTDAVFEVLQALPNLKRVNLRDTQVTQEGLEGFAAAMPNKLYDGFGAHRFVRQRLEPGGSRDSSNSKYTPRSE